MSNTSRRPFSKKLRPSLKELLNRKSKELSLQLGRLYLRMARTEPEAASPKEIRQLRRSQSAPLRASAVLFWSQRRPETFLRAAPAFFEDSEQEVRSAVLEGLVNAAEEAKLRPDDPTVVSLLERAAQDQDPTVRDAGEEAAALLGFRHTPS
jgi:hypothetical protein